MIGRIESFLRSISQTLSRSNWSIRLLKLSKLEQHSQDPGLVMVQIDGLSSTQLNTALQKGRVPFLASLLTRERYLLHQFYSGLPSNTPSVQAEIFYGIKGCIPSFSFYDRDIHQVVKMLDTPYVENFEKKLKEKSPGLLKDGSSYSNMYTGGAQEAHYCFSQLGWSGVIHAIRPWVFPFIVILYIDIFIRTFFLLIIEFVIALYECIRGSLKGRIFSEELRFVWLRVIVCVFLRELVVAGACMDIMRGLPIIHLNFLGYDEQAHCRGPSSSYAHWALQGIDDAIKRINNVIKQSPYRQYDLWVYSDHGQETTQPYFVKYKRTIEDSIQELFGSKVLPRLSKVQKSYRTNSRVGLLKHEKSSQNSSEVDFMSQDIIVTAMGPLGQVYVKRKMNQGEKEDFAKQMVKELSIPLVLIPYEDNKVKAFTSKGVFILPEQTGDVIGNDHPFLEDMKEDIVRMCHHPNAGEFILAGWSTKQEAISFPLEYGAHAALTIEETRAFAMLPMDAPLKYHHKTYLRPTDLREAAQRYLNKEQARLAMRLREASKTLRIMSYNVHGCMGMDSRISTDRIARVIARHNPDIIALQELDASRRRSKGIDQAHKIAQYLEMKHHFHPVFCEEEEQYGNAILSRYPLELVKMAALPQLKDVKKYEPRGAMSVMLEFQGKKVGIINTHLSLWPGERKIQVEDLLSPQWMASDCPMVLCGDFNATPYSSAYKKICEKMRDSQTILSGHRPSSTWCGRYPLSRIDHIFLTSQFKVHAILVPRTSLDQIASDHLPFLVDVSLISG